MAETKLSVLLADEIPAEGMQILQASPELVTDARAGVEAEDLRSIIGDYDALIVRSRTKVTAEIIEAGEQLSVIGRAGIGVDNIDVEAATRRGIIVLNAPGGNVISAAEHTLALMLAVVRHVPQADASVRLGEWGRERFKGIELHGKVLGLVGAGRIGSEVARRARAFGMRVLTYDPYLSKDRADQIGIELVTLPDLLEEADLVSLHCPLTDETQGLIGAEELAMMKPAAYVINAARGGIVDEAALAEALGAGKLAGAALDVFVEEPVPEDNPLLKLENVVALPHLGAATREAQLSVGIEICKAVRDALLNSDFKSAVNMPDLALQSYADLAPLLSLANRLGRVLCGLTRGNYRALEVRYGGSNENALRVLAAAAAQGLLCDIVEAPLTLVNALHVAAERGLSVSRVGLGEGAVSGEFIELRLQTADDSVRVSGALIGEDHPRLISIGDYHVDIRPRGTILILKNRDVPGVIGKVGSVLGAAGVNIAEYHQARLEAGGEALAAISVDGVVDRSVIEQLAGMGEVNGVWQIHLPVEAPLFVARSRHQQRSASTPR